MRLTALLPPPPTPTTLMRAPVRALLVERQPQRRLGIVGRCVGDQPFLVLHAASGRGSRHQKNSLNNVRSRPATRPNAPAPTGRAGSPAWFRCAYITSPTAVANAGLLT